MTALKIIVLVLLTLPSIVFANACDTDKDGDISGSEQYLCENPSYDPTKKPVKGERYSCQGKVSCSQMTSCEEAEFYQDNCPNTKMDGDNDGIPCEKQWC
jgi:hypothetical protein